MTQSETQVKLAFDDWWAVNHPFDWWSKERDGEPLPHADRLRVALLARAAFDAAATQMRDACVGKVRAMGQQWYGEAKKRGAAFSDKGRLAETIASELSSLTLDTVKQKEQSK